MQILVGLFSFNFCQQYPFYKIANTSLAAKLALAHPLQRLQNPKWMTGSGKVSTPRFLLNKFFDPTTSSMRKGRDRGKKRGGKEKNDENSGHYVIASSRPHGCRQLERCMLVPIK